MMRLETPRSKWPASRIDHIAACKVVVRELTKALEGKLFSKIALAKRTRLDWHTVESCLGELLGKNLDGVLSRTTPNGSDLFFIDPNACNTLIDAERKAAREGDLEMTREIRTLWTKHCRQNVEVNR